MMMKEWLAEEATQHAETCVQNASGDLKKLVQPVGFSSSWHAPLSANRSCMKRLGISNSETTALSHRCALVRVFTMNTPASLFAKRRGSENAALYPE